MNKALFITLDNTLINTRSGRKYPVHSKDWILNIDLLDTIERYNKKGYKIIVIDNQDSVEHGFVDESVFNEKVLEVVKTLERACVLPPVSYMFFIGKRDEYYRLPNPGLIYECALEYELDIPNSILISDSKNFELKSNSGIGFHIDIDSIK